MRLLKIIFIINNIVLLVSCRKLVQDEFNTLPPMPMLNSILIPGKPVVVQATFTANINAINIKAIEDADISLFIDGVYTEKLSHEGNGIYTSATTIDEGKMYKCEVDVPDHETITCLDSIPKKPKVYEIVHINEAGKNEEGTTYPAIKITFFNDTSKTRYFEMAIRLFVYGEETPAYFEVVTDPLIINEGLPIALFSNQLINDTVYQLTINYTTGSESTTNGVWHTDLYPLIVEFRSVSQNYYQFAKSAYLYEEGRYPDGLAAQTSVFNTYSNIENAFGIFAGLEIICVQISFFSLV
jgi:hypothetical protein